LEKPLDLDALPNLTVKEAIMNKSVIPTQLAYSIVAVCLLLAGTTVHAQVTCDSNFVEFDQDKQIVRVAPNGVDDTDNVQCGVDLAKELNAPKIGLEKATYRLSDMIVFDRYSGSLQGNSAEGTLVEVLDNSIDCGAIWNGGQLPSVFKFIAGEPRIRFMTISLDQPCDNGWPLDTVVHFTGFAATPENCGKPVIFAAAERMAIKGTNVLAGNGPLVGVSAHAEGVLVPGGCSVDLLGSLFVDRVDFSDTEFGVVASMRSTALVNVNFNNFTNNYNAVLFIDSSQNATLTRNVFNGLSNGSEYFGVLGLTDLSDAPNRTRMVVHNNRFDVSSSGGVEAYAVSFINIGRNAGMSTVVSENRFNLMGDASWGVVAVDVSDGLVAANEFSGMGAGGILIGSDSFPVSGWSVTANSGFNTFDSDSGADVWFGASTSNCVFGPGQNADVVDQGTNNAVLASAGSPGLDAISWLQAGASQKFVEPMLDARRAQQASSLVDRLYRSR
jgi:hypothetical protein